MATRFALCLLFALGAAAPAGGRAQAAADDASAAANRIVENIPALAPELSAAIARYDRGGGMSFAGWLDDDQMLVAGRLGDSAQIFRLAAAGAAPERITAYSDPIASVAVPRQGGEGFVFGKDSGGSEDWQLYYYDLATNQARRLSDGEGRNQGAVWARDGRRFAYTSSHPNGSDGGVRIMTADGESRPLLATGGGWLVQDWSPDDRLLLVREIFSLTHSRPWLVRVDTGERAPLRDPEAPTYYGRSAFAPDGRGVYYIADEDGEFRRLYHLDLASGRRRLLSRNIDWDIEDFALSPDGRHLAFVSNEDGYSRLHLRTVPGHRRIKLAELPDGVVALGDFSPSGDALALTLSTPADPPMVWSLRIDDRKLVPWTAPAAHPDATPAVSPEQITFPSFDRNTERWRRRIPAFYYRPDRAVDGAGHPVLIILHGGPEIQARPTYSATIQYLVNELGIAILVPNVRGSSGYGRSYLRLDDGRKREDAVRDVGALLDWIERQPELDADRVGVSGASYGGYLALAAMAHYADRLRAGASAVGISHFVTFLENTSVHRRDLRRAEYGDERDAAMRAFLSRISPLNMSERIRKPLFVAHGANDPRVPAEEARRIADAVTGNGVEVWYLLFTDEGHGFTRKPNRDYFNAASAAFWRRHLLAASGDG
ncbi:MAG: alpha/beta fold hydrolase [Xanthomonadaceae bacterium]|nr:alpha/beta fold hydrolase [Xanthomonadaceae bacterium]